MHQGICVAEMDRGNRKAGGADIYRLEFSPNGKYVAGTADNVDKEGTQTYIWCPETGKLIFKFAGRNFSFSQDSCLLAGVTFDDPIGDADPINHYISAWNITTGERISHFSVKSAWMDTIIFSPCGEFLAFSSRDESLRVWDVAKSVQKMAYSNFQTPRTVPFYSTEGELFAIVDRQDTIEVWNMEHREKIQISELHPRSIDAAWFREFPQVALADMRTDTTPNKKNQTHNTHKFSTIRESACFPDPVLFLPDGKTLATRGYRNGIVLWDVESKQVRETLLEDQRIASFTVLPSGNILSAHSQDNNIKVWDAGKPDAPIAEFTETDPVRVDMEHRIRTDR